jgi:hypothetical protein
MTTKRRAKANATATARGTATATATATQRQQQIPFGDDNKKGKSRRGKGCVGENPLQFGFGS